jgi:hypothetical protein
MCAEHENATGGFVDSCGVVYKKIHMPIECIFAAGSTLLGSVSVYTPLQDGEASSDSWLPIAPYASIMSAHLPTPIDFTVSHLCDPIFSPPFLHRVRRHERSVRRWLVRMIDCRLCSTDTFCRGMCRNAKQLLTTVRRSSAATMKEA